MKPAEDDDDDCVQELAHEEVVRSLHMEHAKQASKLRQELEQQVTCLLNHPLAVLSIQWHAGEWQCQNASSTKTTKRVE